MVAAALLAALAAAGCDGPDGRGVEAVDREVTILHAFTGEADVAGLRALLDAFVEQHPDIAVAEEGSTDFGSLARARLATDDPPDILLHPQPGLLEDFHRQGLVRPLDFLDADAIAEQMVGGLADLATFDGAYLAQPMRLSYKSLVWYSPATFAAGGYEVPSTWDEMTALTDRMVADDLAPWCIGIESGEGTGWVVTDWVEDVLLRTIGLDGYDRWVAGDLPFASPEVSGALEAYLVPIWTDDAQVAGGREQIAREAFGTSVGGILGDAPACGLHRQATFIEGFIEQIDPDATFGTDYDVFALPPIDGGDVPALGGGDFAALYTGNEAARTFIEFLATPEAGEAWAGIGGFLSPFAPVFDDAAYASDSARKASALLAETSAFRFDGSDLMPGDVGSSAQPGSFWSEMTDWVTGQVELDEALRNIDERYASVR